MQVSRHASASRPYVDRRLWSFRRSFIEALDKSHGMYKSNTTNFKVYFSHSCICKHGRDYTFRQLIHIVLPLSSRRDAWGRKHQRRCLWVGVRRTTATRERTKLFLTLDRQNSNTQANCSCALISPELHPVCRFMDEEVSKSGMRLLRLFSSTRTLQNQ